MEIKMPETVEKVHNIAYDIAQEREQRSKELV